MTGKIIVLGDNCLIKYPQGSGLWMLFLQYILGLKALGHKVVFFELLVASRNLEKDEITIRAFFDILGEWDLADDAVVLLMNNEIDDISAAKVYGKAMPEVVAIIKGADLFWNCFCSFPQSFTSMFRHSVLVDMDPGHLQISAMEFDMGVPSHKSFLTVGGKAGDPDCEMPDMNQNWIPFKPFVYLPLWKKSTINTDNKPFTSITHWNWDELEFDGRRLSLSKREAYLKYIDLPQLSGYPFQLATYFAPDDTTGDRELLISKGWEIADSWNVAGTIHDYQNYIYHSRAEISCPKPIFRELKTGWFSDRSVCYLAAGRPILAEETGFSDCYPTGKGIIKFFSMEEALDGVKEINTNYHIHSKAARQLAEEVFNSEICLKNMIEAC